MTTVDQYAVFGKPISHSKSPRIHQLFAQQTGQSMHYSAQEVSAENFNGAVDQFFAQNGKGLNCTVPLKELAWQYADKLTERAELAGAVNTLKKLENQTVLGDNTDGIGLIRDLTINNRITLSNQKILILGAGGASRGIIGPILEQKPTQLIIANRTLSRAHKLLEIFSQLGNISVCSLQELNEYKFDLIINATSASLNGELPPLPTNLLTDNGSCYDLAYSDQPTAFMVWAATQQTRNNLDGLGMLVEQAAEAFQLWRGLRPSTQNIIDLLNKERQVKML